MEGEKRGWRYLRRRGLSFLIHLAKIVRAFPTTKYYAMTFFGDRFIPCLESWLFRSPEGNSLLRKPITDSNMQMFALVSFWIASKMHETRTLSLSSLKAMAAEFITEQHFTTTDFIEAEVLLMKVTNFDLRTGVLLFDLVQELVMKLRNTAKIGKLVRYQVCLDVIDLMYEMDIKDAPVHVLAGSVLAVSYTLCVPADKCNFPLIPWLHMNINMDRGLLQKVIKVMLEYLPKLSTTSNNEID